MHRQTDGLVDAVYLLGDFGVTFNRTDLPSVGDVPVQVQGTRLHLDGLPFYAGVVHLTKRLDLPVTDAPIVLSLPEDVLLYLGIAELALNGRRLGVRPWAPFSWEVPPEIVRRNDNELTFSLTTTLVGLLEGKRYDPVRRAAVRIVPE